MPNSIEVHKYSIDELIQIIAANTPASEETIKRRHHHIYFKEYFDSLLAKSILVEKNYIDRDYLEDFSSYYVKCFDDYKRKCTRLHFFCIDIDPAEFKNLLQGNGSNLTPKSLNDNYLGFIVLKPLPNTVIGRSCLRTYPPLGHRHFPIVRLYKSNLNGIPLTVESLAYQEQDSVVAACATSALWTAFHSTAELFHHPIYSPVEITKKASEYLPFGTSDARIFPNKGLSTEQMAYAVRSIGLEAHLINPHTQFVLQSSIYAYVKGKIPVLMGVQLFDVNNGHLGRHAITVTGYNVADKPVTNSSLQLLSSRIDRFYVHDDQVGPFARTLIDNKTINIPNAANSYSLLSFWPDEQKKIGNIRAVPVILIIPLYNKIRIPYATILNSVNFFDGFINFLIANNLLTLTSSFEWDVFLTTVNDFKTELFNSRYIVGPSLSSILEQPMPHFMWRATARYNGKLVLDLLFDATDIEQGNYFLSAVNYDSNIYNTINLYSKLPAVYNAFVNSPAEQIISWFFKD